MGYCETVCQLCGVSFAIARLRRPDEPEEAAWSYYGSEFVDVEDDCNLLCGGEFGCSIHQERPRNGEHIAGTGCVSEAGYSGHRISVEEMKGCRAVQCLVKKGYDWIPEDDDEDFETEGAFFLTGIGDGSPDESPLEGIKPARHGVDSILISNTDDFSDSDWGLPFHPTCFDIYKKICKMRTGHIDTEGLFCWRSLECDYDDFFEKFPRDPAVKSANQQWWSHEPGCEYLAANPIEIPGLSQLLEAAEQRADKRTIFGDTEVLSDSQAQNLDSVSSTPNAAKDPFGLLSAEITTMILNHLGSNDVANLRLATPVFRQLPTILFRRLILEDMPWLFEVKDLDAAKVNWYDCYCTVKSSWMDLKGLRNRKRIWQDVEEIVTRIENLRKEGKIGNANLAQSDSEVREEESHGDDSIMVLGTSL